MPSLKTVLLHTWRNGGSVLQNWQHLTALNCKLSEFPAYLEVESGLQLYFQLPGLKIQSYEITRKYGNGKRIWVQLSLCVRVHRDQSLLHFRMAQCEPVPLQPSSCSTVSWQPLVHCVYADGLVWLQSTCLQWTCQLSPLKLLWFISQSWFGSEEMNSCQLKGN